MWSIQCLGYNIESVREETIAEYILQATEFKAHIDIDPTLLVDRIVFQKQFFIIKKNNGFDIRSASLLHNLHLENRMIDAEDLLHIDAGKTINFNAALTSIKNLRQQSTEYLKNLRESQ